MKNDEWTDIKGYENLYQISKEGEEKSLYFNKEKILKQHIMKNGYHQVSLYKDGIKTKFLVHRLVALNFLPNPNSLPQVNHIDGNKSNNSIENLEWISQIDNMKHAFENNLVTTITEKKKVACSENGKKAFQVFLQKHRKPVLQFDKNENFIQKWTYASEASQVLNIDTSSILKCCQQQRKTAGGFKWQFEDKS